MTFSSSQLAAVTKRVSELRLYALRVLQDGETVLELGDQTSPVAVHSIRKSFLSALLGQVIARGVLALDDRIGDLGIDDTPALTELEKCATIRDLLEARSGVSSPRRAPAGHRRRVRAQAGTRHTPARDFLALQQLGLQRPRQHLRAHHRQERVPRPRPRARETARPTRLGSLPGLEVRVQERLLRWEHPAGALLPQVSAPDRLVHRLPSRRHALAALWQLAELREERAGCLLVHRVPLDGRRRSASPAPASSCSRKVSRAWSNSWCRPRGPSAQCPPDGACGPGPGLAVPRRGRERPASGRMTGYTTRVSIPSWCFSNLT